MIVSNFPSLPTFLAKNQKTDYFQMLPSLPTFLGRSVLKSIDGKLWLGGLPSLPILKARVHQYCQQSLADTTSRRQMPRKPRKTCQYLLAVGKSYFAKAMPTMPRNWPRTFCKGISPGYILRDANISN